MRVLVVRNLYQTNNENMVAQEELNACKRLMMCYPLNPRRCSTQEVRKNLLPHIDEM
jgi:hypothetical protein